jgi:hypothetical protein
MVAKNSDDAKPTLEDIDRMIRQHEHKDATDQGMKKAAEERSAQGRGAFKEVHYKKGESLWDRLGRELDAAEKGQNKG